MKKIFSFSSLKTYQRTHREDFPEGLGLRTHRALSWLQRTEDEDDDLDAKFIFLWISFNAAYAQERSLGEKLSDRKLALRFIHELIQDDDECLLYNALWDEFTQAIRALMNNPYVFPDFWDYQSGLIPEDQWKAKFDFSKQAINKAIGSKNTTRVLAILLERLYVLRNQLIHGGATWNSGINRDQIRDATRIMARIVPITIHLMMTNQSRNWGTPFYPVIINK